MFASLRGWEWIIILIIFLLVFGVGRIGKLGEELGKGIKSFREGLKGEDNDEDENDSYEKKEK